MRGFLILAGLSAACSIPVQAQEAVPLQVTLAPPPSANQLVLPANTEITLAMTQDVTTRGDTWSEGDTFNLSVTQDVMIGDYVVIPRGSRGVGRITWLTSRGAFGKSGKMDISIDYVELGGRRIETIGTYRQEGEGETLGTIGGVILAGVFAGFITGKSALIPQGRELTAHTVNPVPLALPAGAAPPVQLQPTLPITLTAQVAADEEEERLGTETETTPLIEVEVAE